jgi:hypothetical protein
MIEAQTFKVLVGGVILRFKKGGDDKLGCNIPTQAALAFMEADGVLPGMPPECGKVEVIWRSNEIGTALECVLVRAIALDGNNQLPKLILGVKFADGLEVLAKPANRQPTNVAA